MGGNYWLKTTEILGPSGEWGFGPATPEIMGCGCMVSLDDQDASHILVAGIGADGSIVNDVWKHDVDGGWTSMPSYGTGRK